MHMLTITTKSIDSYHLGLTRSVFADKKNTRSQAVARIADRTASQLDYLVIVRNSICIAVFRILGFERIGGT